MKLEKYKDLHNKMDTFLLSDYQAKVCKKMKKYREEMYEEYKLECPNDKKNTYSTQSIF